MSNFSLSASQRELMKKRRSGCGAQGGASARSSSSSSITDTCWRLRAAAWTPLPGLSVSVGRSGAASRGSDGEGGARSEKRSGHRPVRVARLALRCSSGRRRRRRHCLDAQQIERKKARDRAR